MKFAIRATILCVCFLTINVIDILTTKALLPLEAQLRIPAPEFSLDEIIRAAAHKYQVPRAFIKSIIAVESAFSPTAVSPKGAVGLMQLMPETARQLGADPSIPAQNVEAGTSYLSWLLHRYANRKHQLRDTIAAYNAGPGAVEKFKGVPPYRETRAYVSRVLHMFAKYQEQDSAGPSSALQRGYLAEYTPPRNAERWRSRRAARRRLAS